MNQHACGYAGRDECLPGEKGVGSLKREGGRGWGAGRQ